MKKGQKTTRLARQAINWLAENPDKSPYDACHAFLIAPQAIYKEINRRRRGHICPCCGENVRKDQEMVDLPGTERLRIAAELVALAKDAKDETQIYYLKAVAEWVRNVDW